MSRSEYAAEALRLAKDLDFAAAAECVEAAFRTGDKLESVRTLLRHRPLYPNAQTAAAAEIFFRAVYRGCRDSFGAESRATIEAAGNLASLLLGIGKAADACPLREAEFQHRIATVPADEDSLLLARDQLALVYRRLGQDDKAAALYENVGLCEHLAGVLGALTRGGTRIASCCRPWSANCHLWVYIDGALDCEGLMREHGTAECVVIHDHRGTHDGSERGLVCVLHHDAIMGRHPSDFVAQG